ncbi:hypothetical protein Apa02nite_073190 [Actinoplanes palleronii]|uniref:Histidine kinase/HSP90-like ATPase domain-containing protein n=2 Tax=Actinoplanes palleronii TaxID=113570 RepID=A0ABQ4BKM3_9ACTN|nr:hypothetical protein Apa02nite_073190 [Actinoplanes palleronii]
MASACLGGCLLILVVRSVDGVAAAPESGGAGLADLAPTAATVLALCLVRWWPGLLATGGMFAGIGLLGFDPPLAAALPLLVVGALGGAQTLLTSTAPGSGAPGPGTPGLGGPSSSAPGLGALIAGLTGAAALFGDALTEEDQHAIPAWRVVVLVAGLAAIVPALCRRHSPAGEPWTWPRLRLVIGAGAAVFLISPICLIPIGQLGWWLGVDPSTFTRYPLARIAIVGAVVLVLATGLAAFAGKWSLAGAATVTVVQIGASTPLILAVAALRPDGATRWWGALAGAALGAAVAASRWRVAAAVSLTVSAATALFIMYEAAGGHPEKMIEQHRVAPALILLVLVSAAATTVAGATAPVLAPRGAVPAALGPFAAVLTLAGMFTTQVSFVRGRTPIGFTAGPVPHMVIAGYLLLAAAAAIAGLGVAHHMTERWAERRQAELIRREAAAAERERLARPIHDGVLQVLALVQREGAGLGGSGPRLAVLAAEQEAALRNLLNSGAALTGPTSGTDLRAALLALAGPAVEVSAPAVPVLLPQHPVAEVTAAVRAALDNVRKHAGTDARTWILLEDEDTGIRVSVRDDGAGFGPHRLAEAARAGRLGVAQSMRGRIADLGGTMTMSSHPGDGTEVEFWVPRRR